MMDEDAVPDAPEKRGLAGAFKRHRRLLFVLGLLWFTGVLGAGIFISGIEPSGGLHVFGTPRWVAGEPGQLRVALRDLKKHEIMPLETVTVTFADQTGLAGPVQVVSQKAGPFVQGTVTAPGRAGLWTVTLDADSPQGPVTAQFPITVVAEDGPSVWPLPPKPRTPMKPDKGPIRLDVRPLDSVMPGGLGSRLVVTARGDAGPVTTPVALKITEGRSKTPLPQTVTTDMHGNALIPLEPMHPIFTFELSAGESWAIRRVKHTNTQFSLVAPSSPVAGGTLPLVVKSLHGRGTIYADLWDGERWFGSSSKSLIGGIGSVSIVLPDPDPTPRLLWVEVYRDAYLPGEARAGRWLVSSQEIETGTAWARSALRKAGYPVGTDSSKIGLRVDLGQLERPTHSPTLLADSTETARQSVNALKMRWQSKFVLALSLSGLALFVIIMVVLIRHQRAMKAQWTLAGGDEDGDGPGRDRIMVDAGYLFLILAVYLAGLIHLLQTIQW